MSPVSPANADDDSVAAGGSASQAEQARSSGEQSAGVPEHVPPGPPWAPGPVCLWPHVQHADPNTASRPAEFSVYLPCVTGGGGGSEPRAPRGPSTLRSRASNSPDRILQQRSGELAQAHRRRKAYGCPSELGRQCVFSKCRAQPVASRPSRARAHPGMWVQAGRQNGQKLPVDLTGRAAHCLNPPENKINEQAGEQAGDPYSQMPTVRPDLPHWFPWRRQSARAFCSLKCRRLGGCCVTCQSCQRR